jgi:hypothetical protein
MIGHCDSSFLHRPFDRGRIPLSHQLPAPASAGVLSQAALAARESIAARDKAWTECKLFQFPSAYFISQLRRQNDAVVAMLAASPAPFPADLTHVEALLCQVCEMFCGRCEYEILAYIRRSFALARADEELPPAGVEPGEGLGLGDL